MIRIRYFRSRCLAASLIGLATAAACPAFYFDNQPGSLVVPIPRLVPLNADTSANPPSARGPDLPGALPPPNSGGAGGAPEPATGLAGLIGLATISIVRWKRRRRG